MFIDNIITIFGDFKLKITKNVNFFMKSFGQRLKKRIKERGLSAKKIAAFLGVHPNTITRWVKNEQFPDVKTAYRLCMFLDCSIDWLVTGHEESALAAYRAANAQQNKEGVHQEITLSGGHNRSKNIIKDINFGEQDSKAAAQTAGKNGELVAQIQQLTPAQLELVLAFIQGIKAK